MSVLVGCISYAVNAPSNIVANSALLSNDGRYLHVHFGDCVNALRDIVKRHRGVGGTFEVADCFAP